MTEKGKTSEFYEYSLILHFNYSEIGSLIRNDAEWNTMILDKAFCSSWIVVLAKATWSRKANYFQNKSIQVRKKSVSPSMMEAINFNQPDIR